MENINNAPIGVFDSGVGGLTVVRELLRQLPGESFIYYADTAHVPYGPRDPAELRTFADAITAFLVNQGCKMVIIACNTSTSLAYEFLQEKYTVPLIGVIEPGIERALAATVNKRIGVFATQATVNSGAFPRLIRAKDPSVEVTAVACPLFVPLVEAGEVAGSAALKAAQTYFQPLREKGVDSLILGCTHYPFLLPVIRQVTNKNVTIINPAEETVSKAVKILQEKGLMAAGHSGQRLYYASGDPEAFRIMGGRFLQQDLGKVRKITLL